MDEETRTIPDPIQWSQGMLLTPNHFLELSGRYELLQQNMAALQPFGWGVIRLLYDKSAIAAGKLEITELEAVMPDGTLVHASGDDIPPFSIKDTEPGEIIYIALPAQRNFVWEGSTARYRPVSVNGTRGIGRLRPLLSLHCGTPSPRFVSMPLLRLRNSQELVQDYEPPWFCIPSDSAVLGICGRVAALIRCKIGFLVAQIRNPAQALEGVPVLRDRLRSLVSALPVFEGYLNAGYSTAGASAGAGQRHCHPFPLYLALCSVAGHASLLGHDLAAPEFHPYDHSDPVASFTRVADFVIRSVNQGVSEHWITYRFDTAEDGFRLTPSEALSQYKSADMQWPSIAIGLRIGPGQGRQTILNWAERCLIASGDVTTKRENRVRGAGRAEWADPPDLTPPAGVLLFAIDKGDRSLNLSEPLHLIGSAPLPAEAILFIRQAAAREV